MSKDLKQQGHLDGLCGIYAVVNATKAVLGKSSINDDEIVHLFKSLCRAVESWPLTLWEGLDFDTMMDVVTRTHRQETILSKVNISYPFRSKAPQSSNLFWQQFYELFEESPGAQAIVGMTYPHSHWIVVRPKTEEQLSIIDSNPSGATKVKDISQIFAGDRRPKNYHWKIERNEVIFFTPRSA